MEKPPEEPPKRQRNPHRLNLIQGGNAYRKGTPNRYVSREIYERMLEAYVHGIRSQGEVMRAVGCSRDTAKKAIEVGWPKHGWRPLRDVASEYDAVDAAARGSSGGIGAGGPGDPRPGGGGGGDGDDPTRSPDAVTFSAFQRQHMTIALAIRSVVAMAIVKAREAVAAATATTIKPMRKVVMEEHLDSTGAVFKRSPRTVIEDVVVSPNLISLASALNELASALARTGMHEIKIADADTPRSMREQEQGGFGSLTNEQIDFIAKNNGRLPPGVTLDMLHGANTR
jgi:hypothetical protein